MRAPPAPPRTAGRRFRAFLDTDVFTAARQRMRYVYDTFDTIVLSWSGGKDSTVIVELAREAARATHRLPVDVLFLDEEVIYPETLDLAQQYWADPEIRLVWACVPATYRNACSEAEPDFIPWDPAKANLWTHVPPDFATWPAGRALTTWRVPPSIPKRCVLELYAHRGGKVINLTGLRGEESFVRYIGVMSSGAFISKKDHGLYHGRPVYDWRAADVWLAIKDFGWPYNRAYDKLWRLGSPLLQCRVAPLFHAEAADLLRRVMLGWPAFWPLVRRRVRGAQAMALYSGKLHDPYHKLPGETSWREVAWRLLLHLGSEQDRTQMHAWVQVMLDEHAKHSSVPLGEEPRDRCPGCDLYWKRIARACARGDRQQRMIKQRGHL